MLSIWANIRPDQTSKESNSADRNVKNQVIDASLKIEDTLISKSTIF